MAGSPVKRVIGTLLFTVALLVTLGFVFLLFAESERLTDVPGTENVDTLGVWAAVILGVIAVLMIILLIIRKVDKNRERQALKEAYYIPETDREAMRAEKERAFADALEPASGPAPSVPDVNVYHIPAIPVGRKAWAAKEESRVGPVHPYYFPVSEPEGVYVNDYIEVDTKGTRIKLRTLLAGRKDWPQAGEVDETPKPEPVEETPAPLPEVKATGIVGGKTEELPGDKFMQELEARSETVQETREPTEAPSNVYYDYPGDTAFIEEVEGIGPKYGQRLREVGVQTTARLCYEDPSELSLRIDVPTRRVRRWQATAELMKVKGIGPQYAEALARSGITGISELKESKAADIAAKVNAYVESIEGRMANVTARRIETWKEAAKGMRRVRLKVPVE